MSVFFSLLIILCVAYSQENDTSNSNTLLNDTLKMATPNSNKTHDSLTSNKNNTQTGLDTIVTYFADKIHLQADSKISILEGNAIVKYKKLTLTAHQITIDWEQDRIFAEGRPDTIWIDTLQMAVDTILFVDTPLFLDVTSGKVDSLRGFQMEMNLESQRGRVFTGITANEQGKYYGQILKRVEPEVMFVKNGTFTTCDLKEPHYQFFSNKMKMMYRNKLIAQPVVLMFGKIPSMIFPYGIFSLKPGRHSGLIVPSYGENTSQGRHFKHLGYYFAPSDYWDVKTTLDYYEKFGSLWNIESRYVRRYYFQGGLSGNYSNQGNTNRWQVQWNHSQRIDPTFSLNANVLYINDASFINQYSYDLADRLRQEINSNISFSKNWTGTRASLSGGLRGTQVLQTKDYSLSLPSLSFRWSDGPIFRPKSSQIIKGFGGIDRFTNSIKTTTEPSWWENITYGYNFQMTNDEMKTHLTSSTQSSSYTIRKRQGVIHNLGLNSSYKVLRHFSISPSVGVTHDWAPQILKFQLSDDSTRLVSEPIQGFFARTHFRTRLGINTKLYGVVDPKGLFGLTIIRHVVTPNVGFSYQPDFWDRKFGIVKYIYNPKTNTYLIGDPWINTYSNATPRRKSLVMQFAISNLFQGKYEVYNPDKKDPEERKVDLFSWDLNTTYNLAADSLKWSDLGMSLRSAPYSGGSGFVSSVNIDLSTTHSFYKFDYFDIPNKRGNEINQFYWDRKRSFPNLLRFKSGRTSIGFAWKKPDLSVKQVEKRDTLQTQSETSFNYTDQILRAEVNDPFLGGSLLNQLREKPKFQPPQSSWSGMTSVSFDYNLRNPMDLVKSASLASSIQLNLTPSWNISYSTSVNLISREVASSGFTTHKDLHCWEIHFTWNPKGVRQGFYLRINVKSADLQDLKLEKNKQ